MEETLDRILDIPHAHALGMKPVHRHEAGAAPQGATVRLPYAEHLVGDPDTGVVHGGVITALLDNTAGMAVRIDDPDTVPQEEISMATLDLRIDYMRPAVPGKDIYANAVCYKKTHTIAFVRGTAYDGDIDDPVATCVATFMIDTPKALRPPKPLGSSSVAESAGESANDSVGESVREST